MSQNDKNAYKDSLNLPQTTFDMKATFFRRNPPSRSNGTGRVCTTLSAAKEMARPATSFTTARRTQTATSTWEPP